MKPYHPETLEVAETACGHFFCRKCLDSWLEERNHCPMCRETVGQTQDQIDACSAKRAAELEEESRALRSALHDTPAAQRLAAWLRPDLQHTLANQPIGTTAYVDLTLGDQPIRISATLVSYDVNGGPQIW